LQGLHLKLLWLDRHQALTRRSSIRMKLDGIVLRVHVLLQHVLGVILIDLKKGEDIDFYTDRNWNTSQDRIVQAQD
jgi:hypothetical protein